MMVLLIDCRTFFPPATESEVNKDEDAEMKDDTSEQEKKADDDELPDLPDVPTKEPAEAGQPDGM